MTVLTSLEREREQLRALAAANPFGAWLLSQRGRHGYIGRLATFATRDPGFPRRGTPRQVADRIARAAWDDDTISAYQDALTEWRTLLRRYFASRSCASASPADFSAASISPISASRVGPGTARNEAVQADKAAA
jgi:hypothetical protein